MENNFQARDNIIRTKSFDFSVRIVNLYKILYYESHEKTISTQLLRSATSVGANIEESLAAFSKKEFIFKLQISYKESFESRYWLKLLFKTEYLKEQEFTSLLNDVEEVIKILTVILKSAKENK